MNKIFNILRKIINCTNINNVIKIFICDGVLGTIESVFSFIPQILIMLFLLNILEDVGLMSRVAFMFDGVMKKIGLNGKALFSLFLGYGCTTTAVLTTRNLENTRLRKRTVLLLPFSSCSAKLPVFLVLSSLFFEKYKYLFVFGLYIFSVFVSILVALFFNRFDNDYENVFLLEMPKLRVPGLKKTFFDSMKVLKEFVLKVGVLILFFGSTVWLLQNISTSFKFLNGKNFEMSLLYKFSELISPIFKFVGIENVGVVASLLLGLIAKEMIIVGFAMMNGVGGSLANLTTSLLSSTAVCNFTLTSSIVFLIFVLLYSPCFSALATIKSEMGLKTALIVFAFQFMIAYFVSFIVYRFILNPNWVLLLICVIVLDILFVLVLKSKKKKYCRGNCNACRKI